MSLEVRVMFIPISPSPNVIASTSPNRRPREEESRVLNLIEVEENPTSKVTGEEGRGEGFWKKIAPNFGGVSTIAKSVENSLPGVRTVLTIRV